MAYKCTEGTSAFAEMRAYLKKLNQMIVSQSSTEISRRVFILLATIILKVMEKNGFGFDSFENCFWNGYKKFMVIVGRKIESNINELALSIVRKWGDMSKLLSQIKKYSNVLAITCCSLNYLNELWLSMIYVNFMMIISCLMPLKLGDGYFALCDLFGVDNLRKFVFSFVLRKDNCGRATLISILYLMAFIVFYIFSIALFIFSAFEVWNNSTLTLKVFMLFYVLFSFFICGFVFLKKFLRKRHSFLK